MNDVGQLNLFCEINNIPFEVFAGLKPDSENRIDAYELRGSGAPIGLRLKRTGEFGNNIIQILHAVFFARKYKLKYIKIDGFGSFFKKGTHYLDDGLVIYIAEETPQISGAEIYGRFFSSWGAAGVFRSLGPTEAFKIVRYDISEILKLEPTINVNKKKLHLHVRGGE